MFSQTEIIVLNYTKYSESSIIIHALTKKHGRQSLMVYGIGGTRNKKLGMFQPLSILDTELYFKPNSSLQKIKEYKPAYNLFSITNDIRKSSLALFISEILYRSVKEENADERLYDFIRTTILILEESSVGIPIFHIAFMVKLARQLGFMNEEPVDSDFYDFKENHPTTVKPIHEYYLKREDYNMLLSLLFKPYSNLNDIIMNSNERDMLLQTTVKLFELHLLNLNTLKSYLVLKEAFGA